MSIDQSLSRAYELIEADQLDDAVAILEPILEDDKDNADAWWLYAHAVTDRERARQALMNVRRIDPDYPGVDELVEAFETRPTISPISKSQSPSLLPPVPATLPGIESSQDDDDDWDALDEDNDDELPIWRRPVFLLAAGLLIFLVVAALVIFRPDGQMPTVATATDVASNLGVDETPTIEPFETPISTPFSVETEETEVTVETTAVIDTGDSTLESLLTEETAETTPSLDTTETAEATAETTASIDTSATNGEGDTLLQALTDFTLSESGVAAEQTVLGNTLIANVCTTPGGELRSALAQVMNVLAEQVGSGSITEVDAVGARMFDCSTSMPLLVIGAAVSDINSYVSDNITEEEFQARWVPIG